MQEYHCCESNCTKPIIYICCCKSPNVCICEDHLQNHLAIADLSHQISNIAKAPSEKTKNAILVFLNKEKLSREENKSSLMMLLSQNIKNAEGNISQHFQKIDEEIELIDCIRSKIHSIDKVSLYEKDNFKQSLLLESEEEALNLIRKSIPQGQKFENYSNLFSGFSPKIKEIVNFYIKNELQTALDEKFKCFEQKIRKDLLTNKQSKNDKKHKENRFDEIYEGINKINEKLKTDEEILNNLKNKQNLKFLEIQDKIIDLTIFQRQTLDLSQDSDIDTRKIDQDFKRITILYENSWKWLKDSNIEINNIYKTYKSEYSKFSENLKYFNLHSERFLYLIDRKNRENENAECTKLEFFDTEDYDSHCENLNTPEPLHRNTCVAQMPDKQLFCYGNYNPAAGAACIIDFKDENWSSRALPNGFPCWFSSAVFYDNSVYCFGGKNSETSCIPLASKFDIEKNTWSNLAPLPCADYKCSSIVYNENILIAGFQSPEIWRYHIRQKFYDKTNINCSQGKKKILISGAVRLYLIECNGEIYESGIGDDNQWEKLNGIGIKESYPNQVNWTYSRGSIYIGCLGFKSFHQFSLNEKKIIKLL